MLYLVYLVYFQGRSCKLTVIQLTTRTKCIQASVFCLLFINGFSIMTGIYGDIVMNVMSFVTLLTVAVTVGNKSDQLNARR